MTSPDRLRARSLRAFKAMLVSGLLGTVLLIGLPQPGFRGVTDPTAQAIAVIGLALLVLALVANLVALADGILAWRNGAGPCPWVVVCGLLLAVPVVLFLLEV